MDRPLALTQLDNNVQGEDFEDVASNMVKNRVGGGDRALLRLGDSACGQQSGGSA